MESVTPYLTVDDAAAALAFYAEAFGAHEDERWTDDAGHVGHAQISIGSAVLFVSDEYPEYGAIAPSTLGGTSVALHLSVADADATHARAVAAGATLDRPVTEQPDGRRGGWVRDPYGHRWSISSVTSEEPTLEQLNEAVSDSFRVTRDPVT
ncbi:MAG: VOC family protein [Propionibacteriaceae bacterium]